jgi:hypothetical protein
MGEREVEQLKQQLQQQVAAAGEEHDRYMASLQQAAGPQHEMAAVDPALAVLGDRAQPEERRLEVIRRAAVGMAAWDQYVVVLLTIAGDRDEPPELRMVALQTLGAAAFEVLRFRPHEDDYRSMLRTLAGDPDGALREAAVSTLAVQHDREIQQVLIAGLEGRGELPVGRERAISLLAEDDHLDNLPWIEELYGSPDEPARVEAVRLMGSYTAARDTLEAVARDRDESAQVRLQSAASLRNLDAAASDAVAKEIAVDPAEDPAVRTASLTALHHLGDVYDDDAFVQRLQSVSEEGSEVSDLARTVIEQRPGP